MADKIPNLSEIPNIVGYMVIDEDKIITSAGDLENNEDIARTALKIAYTASKIPVNHDSKAPFKRISMVMENQYVFMMTIDNNKKIYLVKRTHQADENIIC